MNFALPNPDYEGCEACVHSDDSEEICVLRRCIHAASRLNECYLPKSSTNESDSEITECKDCIYSEGKPISDGRLLCTVHGHYMHYCSMALKRRKEITK